MSRVLVTGSSGFIGRHVVLELARRGYEVHAADIRTSDSLTNVEWHQLDLFDSRGVDDLIDRIKPTHLVHLAWYAEHGKFWNSPLNLDWVGASARLFKSFVAGGGKRAVFAGTCAEYDWSHPHLSEDRTPSNPTTLYGVCKNSLRQIVESFGALSNLEVAWGRIFFLYGPNEDPRRFIPSVLIPLRNGQPAIVRSGSHIRDFMHVEDIAGAFAAILDSGVRGIVNIASGEPVKLGDVARILAELTHGQSFLQVQDGAASKDNPLVLTADVDKLKSIGFKPRYSLRQGLATLIS